MKRQLTLSILPVVNNRKEFDFYDTPSVSADLSDEEVGSKINYVLTNLRNHGVDVGGSDSVLLEVKVYS